MTMRGNQAINKRFGIEDDLNEISIIRDSTNLETTQIQEESFSIDLLKKLQEVDNGAEQTVSVKKIQGPFFMDADFDDGQ